MNRTDFQNAALAQNMPFLVLDHHFFPALNYRSKEGILPYVEEVISTVESLEDFEGFEVLQPNEDRVNDAIYLLFSENNDFPIDDGTRIYGYVLNIEEWSIYDATLTIHVEYTVKNRRIA